MISLALAVTHLTAVPCHANGDSFFRRVPEEKEGRLIFSVVDQSRLPQSNQLLIKGGKKKVEEAVAALKQELDSATSDNIKAWKWFLLGEIQFEKLQFKEAVGSFSQSIKLSSDPELTVAAMHRKLVTHVILRDGNETIAELERIKKSYPNHNRMDPIFWSYPNDVCYPRFYECYTPEISIQELDGKRSTLDKISQLQDEVAELEKGADQNVVLMVPKRIELAKVFEGFCPLESLFENVCLDALEVYKDIYDRYPKAPGADFAFLRVQQSKFAYEYDGDPEGRYRALATVKFYGPFLEQYPDSEQAKEIQATYDSAKQLLERLGPEE